MNILQAIADPQLLGASPALRDLSTWKWWFTFLAAVYGLPLDAEGEERFCKATGRSRYNPPPGGWPEVVCIVGRQAGKTLIGSLIVAFESAFAETKRSDGELYSVLVAQDWRASIRASFSYIKGLLEASPVLRGLVTNATTDTLDLRNGQRVATYPCRPAGVRGIRARCVVCDELAFYKSSEGNAVDVEMLRSVRPALAMSGGKLIAISSPYGQAGALWDLHRKNFGRDHSSTLVWQSDAPTMNPSLPADYLARMREDDPEAHASEVLGQFRPGLAQLLDPEALAACVRADHRELPPASGVEYVAFTDPSGGRSDAWGLSIAHKSDGERIVVDLVRAWPPPFNPTGVVEEIVDLLRGYRITSVTGDRYGGEFPVEHFRKQGVEYRLADRDRSALYLGLLPLVNSGSIELPDDPTTLRELRMLERRRGLSGRDRVDHPRGAHDDRANSVAGVVQMLGSAPAKLEFWGGGDSGSTPAQRSEPVTLERLDLLNERWYRNRA
jgi:hypothetical protein